MSGAFGLVLVERRLNGLDPRGRVAVGEAKNEGSSL